MQNKLLEKPTKDTFHEIIKGKLAND